MFGWLGSILGWSVSGVDDLWHKVVQVIQAVYSWAAGEIGQVIADINSVYQWAYTTAVSTEQWVASEYTAFNALVDSVYNTLTSWVKSLIASAYGYTRAVLSWAGQQISRLYADVRSWIGGVEAWVLGSIWNPLYNLVSGTLQWIGREGAWAIYMLTHPDQLSLLLGRYILTSWSRLGHRYAGAVGRWLVHGMLSMTDEVAGIIEDIIAGIL